MPFRVLGWNHQKRTLVESIDDLPMLLPHQWLWALCHSGREQFTKTIVGVEQGDLESEVMQFWEHFSQQPFAIGHPAFDDMSRLEKTIPLVVHIDGAESFTDREAVVFSISSALNSRGHVFDSKLLILVNT